MPYVIQVDNKSKFFTFHLGPQHKDKFSNQSSW